MPAGSPPPGEPAFLVVGKLQRPHGLRGEIIMEVITDFPERLRTGVTVYVGEAHQPQRIRGRRIHGKGLLVAFDSVSDPEAAGQFRNQLVYVRSDDRPSLPEGEYYHHQLLGLSVESDEGQVLGRLEQILGTGANDVYIVRPEEGPEILLPATDEVILEVNLEQGKVKVHLLPGLLPE